MSKQPDAKKGILTRIGEGITSGGIVIVKREEHQEKKTGQEKK